MTNMEKVAEMFLPPLSISMDEEVKPCCLSLDIPKPSRYVIYDKVH